MRRSGTTVDVVLNVYDLSPQAWWAATVGFAPHHTGVEISGREYGFYGSGIEITTPRTIMPPAQFREAIVMGTVEITTKELEQVLQSLGKDFPGSSYDVVHRNCNVFSNALCMRLLNKPIPGWINRLATMGGSLARSVLGQVRGDEKPVTGCAGGERGYKFVGQGYSLSGSQDKPSSASQQTTTMTKTTTSTGAGPVQQGSSLPVPEGGVWVWPLEDASAADPTKATVQIQIKLADGSRVSCRFLPTHTVQDVHQFLDIAYPLTRGGTTYVLFNSYPRTQLTDRQAALSAFHNTLLLQVLA